MKFMTWLKIKFALRAGAVALFAGGAATLAVAQTNTNPSTGDKPDAAEIVAQSRAAYAALTSYSDEGKTVATIGPNKVAPTTYAIKLARPNLYRIDWAQDMGFYSQTGMVWSAGNGDFTKMNRADQPTKAASMEMALAAATGVSGGGAGSIPGTFFSQAWGNRLGAAMQSAKRKPDETIGGVDCYVLTETTNGRTQTLWIGKQDFLIRQFETDTSAAVLKKVLDDAARKNPEKHLPTGATVGGDVKSVETHTNIVVNQALAKAVFEP